MAPPPPSPDLMALPQAGRRPAAGLLLAMGILTGILAGGPRATAQEFQAAGAAPRGFFDWAVIAGGAWLPELADPPPGLDLPIRLGGAFATRDELTNLVLSLVPTVRWQPPGFEGNGFVPYISTGPGYHFQGSWSSLGEFGGVEVATESALKWHLFLGAALARGRRADLIVETRYTVPSDLAFDYVAVGIRIRPELR